MIINIQQFRKTFCPKSSVVRHALALSNSRTPGQHARQFLGQSPPGRQARQGSDAGTHQIRWPSLVDGNHGYNPEARASRIVKPKVRCDWQSQDVSGGVDLGKVGTIGHRTAIAGVWRRLDKVFGFGTQRPSPTIRQMVYAVLVEQTKGGKENI